MQAVSYVSIFIIHICVYLYTATGIWSILMLFPAIRNPLLPSAAYMRCSAENLILILEGTLKKISYERRDYESVDEKSLS